MRMTRNTNKIRWILPGMFYEIRVMNLNPMTSHKGTAFTTHLSEFDCFVDERPLAARVPSHTKVDGGEIYGLAQPPEELTVLVQL